MPAAALLAAVLQHASVVSRDVGALLCADLLLVTRFLPAFPVAVSVCCIYNATLSSVERPLDEWPRLMLLSATELTTVVPVVLFIGREGGGGGGVGW